MKVGPVVRPKLETLGNALAGGKKPLWPLQTRFATVNHWKTGRPSQGPTYHQNHPTLQSPNVPPAMPVRSTQGPSTTQIQGYLRQLHGN